MASTPTQAAFLSSLKTKPAVITSPGAASTNMQTSTPSGGFTPSNPSSTVPVPAPTYGPTQPAKSTYINSLKAPGSAEAASAQQAKDMQTYFPTANGTTTGTGTGTGVGGTTGTGTGTTGPASTPLSEYLKQYRLQQGKLNEAKDPNSETGRAISSASKSLADINSEIEKKKLATRRRTDAALDMTGGTTAGARDIATLESRRGNSELADLAVQQTGYSNTLQALQGDVKAQVEYAQSLIDSGKALQIGDDLVDPQTGSIIYSKPKAGFELGAGQERYEYDPTTKTYNKVASVAPKEGAGSSDVLSIAEAKTLGVPYGTTRAQAQALGKTPGVASSDASSVKTNALTSAKALLTKFDEGTGTSAVGGNILNRLGPVGDWLGTGTGRQDFVVQFNNLKSLLSLDNVKLLKGQGAVSDAERRLLEQASAKLDRSQSEEEFRSALSDIVTALSGAGDSSSAAAGGSVIEYNGKNYQTDAEGNFDPNKPIS